MNLETAYAIRNSDIIYREKKPLTFIDVARWAELKKKYTAELNVSSWLECVEKADDFIADTLREELNRNHASHIAFP